MSIIKRLAIVLAVVVGISGCYVEEVEAQVPVSYGCVVYVDPVLGEQEVCNTHYVIQSGAVVFYAPAYGIWVAPGAWYRGGVWYRGYHPGWYANRGVFYGHGYYGVHGYRGYYGGGYRGGFHGGGHGRR